MDEDRLKISIDIDFDNYNTNLQNLNRALERLSKETNLKLDFDINKNTTKQLNQINESLNNIGLAAVKMNNTKVGLNIDNVLNQIKELKNYSGSIEDIRKKLSAFGEIKSIKSNIVDENGIGEFIASIDTLQGKIINLRYSLSNRMPNGNNLFELDGITSISDNTDKLINKVNEFKTKWNQLINDISHPELLPSGTIDKLQKSLNDLQIDSGKLDFDNIKKQIRDVSNESEQLFRNQQSDLQKVISFIDRYNSKINDLYRNNNGGIKNDDILNLENKLNSMTGTSDTSKFKSIEIEYSKLIEQQKNYAKQIQDENKKLKEQENLIKYISSQQERLKNIQSNFSTKIDTNSGLYGNLQNQYNNIFNLLNDYKEKKQAISTEDKINITEQINNLRRLSNEYLNVNNFIKTQQNELNNIARKYKTVLNPNEVERYINALKGFDPETNNLIGDMNKVIEKHQQLKNELNERVRLQNLGENIGNLSSSGIGMNSGLKEIQQFLRQNVNAGANVSSISNAMDSLGNKIRTVNYSVNEGHNVISKYRAVMDETSGSIYNMSKGVQDLSSKHGSLGESIQAAAMGFLKFQLVAGGFMTILNSLRQGISDVNTLNESITNISMVTGESINTVNQYMQQYAQLSQQLHTTTTDVASAAEEFLRAGNNQKESLEMVKASTIMSKEAGISQQESAEGLIAISNAYGILPKNIMSVVDVMTKLDNISASSVSEMNTAVQKTASSAKEAGIPLNKLLSYIVEISHVTRTAPSTIGTGINSILSRYSSIKMGKNYDPNSGEEISLNNVEKSLKTVGISIRSDKDTFKDFSVVLDEVGSKWSKFTDRQKNLISTQLAGTYQRNQFTALMDNYDKALDLQTKSTDSAGEAMKRYQTYAQSTKAKLDDLKGTIQRFWNNLISSKEINHTVDSLNTLVQAFSSLTNHFGLLPTLLTGIVPILTQFDKFKNFKPFDMTSQIGSLKVFGKEIVNLSNAQGNLTILGNTLSDIKNKIKNLPQSMSEPYIKAIDDIQEFNGTIGKTPTLLERTSASMQVLRQSTVLTTIATGALKVAEIALNAAITMGLSIAIGFAIEKITEYMNRVDTLKEKNQELMQSTQQSIQSHQSNIQSLTDMSAKYKDTYDRIQDYRTSGLQPTTEDTESLKEMNRQLAEKFPDIVQGYDSQGEAVLNLKGNLQGLIDKENEAKKAAAQKLIDDSGFKKEDQMNTTLIKDRLKTLSDNGSGGLGQTFTEASNKLQYLKDSSANSTQRAAMRKQLQEELKETGNWYKKFIPIILQVNDAYGKLNPTLQVNIKNWANQNKAFSKMSGKDVQKQVNEVVGMYSSNSTLPLINDINKLNTQSRSGAMSIKTYTKNATDLINQLKKMSGTKLDINQLKKLFDIDTSKIPKNVAQIKELQGSVSNLKKEFSTDAKQIAQYQNVLNNIKSTGKLSDDDKKILQEDPDLIP